jgi:hypothetical protein
MYQFTKRHIAEETRVQSSCVKDEICSNYRALEDKGLSQVKM